MLLGQASGAPKAADKRITVPNLPWRGSSRKTSSTVARRPKISLPRKTILTLAAVLGALMVAPAAHASTSCGYTAFKQPFLPWSDDGDYVLAKSANFDGGSSGWTLKNGAKLVAGGNTLMASS